MKRKKSNIYSLCLYMFLISVSNIGFVNTAETRTLYVAERYNGNVDAIDTITGAGEVVASGLGGMVGATVDRKGRLFVHRYNSRAVALVDPVNHTFTDIVTGINGHGLFADPNSDTLYLAGYYDRVVYRLTEVSDGNWAVDVVVDGLGAPIGVYLDGDLLYVSDRRNRKLYVKNLIYGTLEKVVDLPSGGEIIDREAGGDLIIGTANREIYRVNTETKQIVTVYKGFANPAGIVVDTSDNTVLVSEHNGSKITRLNLETNSRQTVSTFVSVPWQPAFKKEVSIPSTPAEVAALVKDMLEGGCITNHGVANAIISSLENAQRSLETSPISARNMLEAAIKKIEAQAGKKVCADGAEKLVGYLNNIIDGL